MGQRQSLEVSYTNFIKDEETLLPTLKSYLQTGVKENILDIFIQVIRHPISGSADSKPYYLAGLF